MAFGLAGWLALAASSTAAAPVLLAGVAGSVLTGAAVVWPVTIGPALAASCGAYAILLVIDDPGLDTRAAGVAAALLVVGELTGWSRELSGPTRDEPGGAWCRPVWIAGAAVGALALAWTLLAVADLTRLEGLAIEGVGALAALAAVLLLVRRSA